MADDLPLAGQPQFDPLPGWPAAPDAPSEAEGPERPVRAGGTGPEPSARPPSAPPPGWTNPPPAWAEPPAEASALRPAAANGGPGRLPALRSRKPVLVGALVVLLLAGAIAVIVVVSGSDKESGGASPSQATPQTGKSGGTGPAGSAAPGTDIPLLDGRLVVVARAGWEQRDSAVDTASLRLELSEPSGRELLTTLTVVALPGGSSLDRLLTIDRGSRFLVTTSSVPLQATAEPGRAGRVVAGAVLPDTTFFFSISISAIDGDELDAALLQKLFTEQVAPQLRFP